MTFRKAAYITDFAGRVQSGAFDLDAVQRMDDAGAIRALSELKGIGVWTAEMILLFCMPVSYTHLHHAAGAPVEEELLRDSR